MSSHKTESVPSASRDEKGATAFIAATREHIRRATDPKILADWWKSQEQGDARRAHKLTNDEVTPLKEYVIARCKQLTDEGMDIPADLDRRAKKPTATPSIDDPEKMLAWVNSTLATVTEADNIEAIWTLSSNRNSRAVSRPITMRRKPCGASTNRGYPMADLDGKCFVVKNRTLVPADFAADEFMAELKPGSEVVVQVRKARNPAHLQFFFALLRKALENTDGRWADEEDLLDDLKIGAGHVRRRINGLTGEEIIEPKSISFAAMDELKFRRFTNRCFHLLGQVLGVDAKTLMDEVVSTQAPARSRQREVA